MTRRLLALLPLVALLGACATQHAATPGTVAALIGHDPQLSTFNGLLVRAGLEDSLKGAGPVTIFAPTNDAFRALPAKELDALAANPAQLKKVLSYHVVPAQLKTAQVKIANLKTAEGASLAIARAGDYVTANDAMVQTADLTAANGVVHTVDRVLMPPR